MNDPIDTLLHQLIPLQVADALKLMVQWYPGKVTFSTSFSMEDQVITHEIVSNQLNIELFSLDTGRLFPETYSVWINTIEKYNTQIRAYYPDHELLEEFVTKKGPNAFYESVENRKGCCFIRKVEPLKRALTGYSVWITGLRAEHSSNRKDLPIIEWDESNNILKYHPLLHWTTTDVKQYITNNEVPYNPLHDRGFISIGCAPCTRAVRAGEDFRAGRWWWEDQDKKECGLHVHNSSVIGSIAT